MKRVLLVGWDSADWSIVTPLLDSGQLPSLSRLIEGGVSGKLISLQPIQSIITWTSIATGKTADKHGILGALEPDPVSGRLHHVTGKSRRAATLWEMTSSRGLRTHVLGWYGAVPAEEVRGVFVSSMYATKAGYSAKAWPLPADCVHPPALGDILAELRMHPADVPPEALLSLVPRAREIDQRYDDRLARIALGLSHCCSIHSAATWTLEQEPWDFAAVYYNAIGYFSELFMPYYSPRMEGIGQQEFEYYSGVMDGMYRFHDLMLGRLMELAGPETAIVLVSDHGYWSGDRRPRAGTANFKKQEAWFTPQGMVCMGGPGMRKDELLRGAGILDIAPTILTLLGLPVGEDMDGGVLLDAFETPAQVSRIASWDETPQPTGVAMEQARAQGLADQFAILNTFDADRDRHHPAELTASEDLRFNLVCVYMNSGRPIQG